MTAPALQLFVTRNVPGVQNIASPNLAGAEAHTLVSFKEALTAAGKAARFDVPLSQQFYAVLTPKWKPKEDKAEFDVAADEMLSLVAEFLNIHEANLVGSALAKILEEGWLWCEMSEPTHYRILIIFALPGYVTGLSSAFLPHRKVYMAYQHSKFDEETQEQGPWVPSDGERYMPGPEHSAWREIRHWYDNLITAAPKPVASHDHVTIGQIVRWCQQWEFPTDEIERICDRYRVYPEMRPFPNPLVIA